MASAVSMQRVMVALAVLVGAGAHGGGGQPSGGNAAATRPGYWRLRLARAPAATVAHAAGKPLTLRCDAAGAPAPHIRWFRNDNPVYEHDMESNEPAEASPTSFARVTSSLIVTAPHDQDVYTCVASTGHTTARASTTVFSSGETETSERLRLFPLAPRIVSAYALFLDEIGRAALLPCRARGHPRPTVTWYIKDEPVVNHPRMKVLRSGALQISALRWADTGALRCRARNAFGSAHSELFLYAAARSS